MENKCPKCQKKLSVFYIKPICPQCGCDMMYYNMETRLQADHEQAEAEYEKLYALIDKVMRVVLYIPKLIKKKFRKNK